ncbi:serine/threonine-protein kinase [Methanofollis fontis]|uniref:Protein kinase domain-containing protein n=1 Tax=Methanofollis fontis TaxID=2052832 RepID=A0A483CUT1_9EURY|nr:serine/threonine-protein kinase [Methanofollis fontis]TAJ44707.1 hypothetical protein CUJ86_05245 [Methanofollis fontis]
MRGAVWTVVVLFFSILLCSSPVMAAAEGGGGAGAAFRQHQDADSLAMFQSLLEGRENLSAALNETPGRAEFDPVRTPGGMNISDRDPGIMGPAMAVGGAYVIFLVTFGLSALALLLLSRSGERWSAGYRFSGGRAAALALGCCYGALALAIGLLSIPVFSFFSTSMMVGDLDPWSLIVAFLMVYGLLSSLVLAYGSFARQPRLLVQACHPLPPLAFAAIMLGTGLPAFRGLENDPLILVVVVLSVLLPYVHFRLLSRVPAAEGDEPPRRSAVTTVVGDLPATVRSAETFPPDLSERYMDPEIVGRGGMALVFRARRREDGETVAVKVPIRYDEVAGHCFMKEMNLWKGLSHENIVKVYAYNILPVPFVEMEYVGPSLAEVETPCPPAEAVRIISGVAAGLAHAHAGGLVHRDIKPGNILMAADGTPKITDWGLGKDLTESGETRFVAFSLDYSAPEQISPGRFGRPDARTDIFQTGVVLYELLTGRLPFAGEGIGGISVAILTTEPTPPSAVDPGLEAFDAVIARCLAKEQDRRYQSIGEFVSDLEGLG